MLYYFVSIVTSNRNSISQQMSKVLWVNQIGLQASNAFPVEITDGMIVYDLKEKIKRIASRLTYDVWELVIIDTRNGNEELRAGAVVDAYDPGTDLAPRYLFKLPSAGMR